MEIEDTGGLNHEKINGRQSRQRREQEVARGARRVVWRKGRAARLRKVSFERREVRRETECA